MAVSCNNPFPLASIVPLVCIFDTKSVVILSNRNGGALQLYIDIYDILVGTEGKLVIGLLFIDK